MVNKAEWFLEEEWLKYVLTAIDAQLQENQLQVQRFRDTAVTTNKDMWEDLSAPTGEWEDDIDVVILTNQYFKESKHQILAFDFYRKMVERLKRLHITPYFGRIDFAEKGEVEEKIYIGLATLFDEQKNCLIYDWRAPISSMFYDFETGKAEYSCKSGQVEGEIFLKRQYKITDGEIKYMFDTNLTIGDEILQQLLSQHATGKMKHIVTSIQREQNTIIRDDSHQLLIVQGPAGSGKTSIALHRVAYLLYKYRNAISSENILIFSPNDVFSDYISNVLPELGEENMMQLTFQDYAEDYLSRRFEIEDVFSQLEYFYGEPLTPDYQARVAGTRYKLSFKFHQVLKNYVRWIENSVDFQDITYLGQTVITKADLQRLWSKEFFYLPYGKRLKKIRRRVLVLLKPFKKARRKELEANLIKETNRPDINWFKESLEMLRKEVEPIRAELNKMIRFDVYELYFQLFSSEKIFSEVAAENELENFSAIAQQTLEAYARRKLQYEDVAPLLFLKRALTGESMVKNKIKHVFIDEAQDYSPLHYEIIRQLFPNCNLTVLGDINQSIHPYVGVGDYQNIADIFAAKSSERITLQKSYRSTQEISAFVQSIISAEIEVEIVRRSGAKVQVVEIDTEQHVAEALVEGLKDLRASGAESIALICKTASESARIFALLKNELEIRLVTKDDREFRRDTVIIPSYLAKGLEFDAVLVYISGENSYRPGGDANLLYMVCSRALHFLKVYYTGVLTPLIPSVQEEYCEFAKFTLDM